MSQNILKGDLFYIVLVNLGSIFELNVSSCESEKESVLQISTQMTGFFDRSSHDAKAIQA